MFPRRFYPADFFAPRFFPQSQGDPSVVAVPPITEAEINFQHVREFALNFDHAREADLGV